MNHSQGEKGKYLESLKATSISGITQIFQIVFKLINTKMAALLLGPSGIGLIGLFQSTTGLVSTIFGFGLGNSAVRDIARERSEGNDERISQILQTLQRLVWVTGLAGAIFCFLFSRWLSQITFDSEGYSLEFSILGICVFLNQLNTGQLAVLQGFRRLKELALVSVAGSGLGIIFALPLYWFYREKAIVPVQIILGLIPVIVVFLLVKKFRLQHYPLPSFQKFRELAFPMLKLGLSTMVSGLVLLIALWLVRILVQRQFGNAGVGQFQAGWGVTTIYLQMIFQAMSRDYYPRLSGLSGNHASMVKLVNEQLHLALLLGTPLLLLAISAAPIIIQALYSDGFDSAVIQLQWLALGTVFKLVSWPLGFVFLALRKSGIYLLTETIAAVGLFAFSYFFMGYFGLNGIGLAYSINYVVYSLLVLVLSMNLIDFKFDSFTKLLLGLSVALSLFVFYSFTYTDQLVLKVLSCLASILMTTYYLIQLNKRTGLINYLCNRILKKGI